MVKIGLTIAGFDPTGAAGVVADIKTFHAFGVYGISVITVITAQSSTGIRRVLRLSPDVVDDQIKTVLEDVSVSTIKIGVLGSREVAEVVGKHIRSLSVPKVLDPVIRASDGTLLADEQTLRAIVEHVLPHVTVVTPNVMEAEIMSGVEIRCLDDVKRAAEIMCREHGVRCVLIKGCHLSWSARCVDVLYVDGRHELFEHKRIPGEPVHGLGCALSTAIAANLINKSIIDAVREAERYMENVVRYSLKVGRGRRFSNPLFALEVDAERYRMIKIMREAIKILEESGELVADLIPETQSNLVYSLPREYALSRDDVLAIPGRIVRIGDKVRASSFPEFGASRHLASAVLTAIRYDPDVRSCMNVRFDERVLEAARELGYRISYFDRREEPEEVRRVEGMTIPWGVAKAIERAGRVPDVIYDLGGWGKEPMIRVFGRDPVEVVNKVLALARRANLKPDVSGLS